MWFVTKLHADEGAPVLKDSAELYRQMVEAAPCALVVAGQDGRIALVNGRAERLFGYGRNELAGQPLEHLVPERLRAGLLLGAGGRDFVGLRKDRSEFAADVVVTPIRTRDAAFVLVSVTDTTEHRRAADRLRQVVESAPNAIVLAGADGRIVLVNAQVERLFGYRREELVGQSVELLVPERFRARHPGQRAAFQAAPAVRAMGAGRDLFALTKDGREFPVEIGLAPVRGEEGEMVLASIIDITERKRAEEKFRRVVESAPNAIVVVDREGRIQLANAQTERIFGYAREELVGRPVDMLVPERLRLAHPGHRAGFFANPSTRSMGVGRDLYGLRKDGREFPVEIGLNPIQSEEGLVVLASIIDISERKKAEARFHELMQQMQETSGVLGGSIGDILAATTQVAAASAQTATAVSETMTTVEEVKQTAQVAVDKAKHVAESAQKTADIAQGGRRSVEESIESMGRIQGQMESIAESIVRLSEQGQAIGEIIASVNDLAEQSNLLAVNAAIEAAKAGEQGKGFAVVAQEVKSLAEQSKQATAQVRAILGDIQKATSGAVLATEQGAKAVEAGVRLSQQSGEAIRQLAESITEAARAATQIAVSAQQQLVGMDQAVLAIQNISQASGQNVASSRQTEAVAQNLKDLGARLKALVDMYRG